MKARSAVVAALACTLLSASCKKPEREYVEPRTGLRFVRIDAGEFTMGSPASEIGHRPDETEHRVRITRAFFMSTTEVTQRQWSAIMGTAPSHFRGDPDAPVEQVTWYDTREFIRRLNETADRRFRLPTEAEWEYACLAGSTSAYNVGDSLSSAHANYDARYPSPGQPIGTFRGRTTRVASYAPNAWGLYDMHGNVWEWCEDEYCPYPPSMSVNPRGRCGSPFRVIRGGSWYFNADSARSALRYTHEPHLKGFSIGFRIVCDVGS
jgi:formylglycine-generating enzyme required for sulfatase activity